MVETHLVSFADGWFKSRKAGFEESARKSGFFDSCQVYDGSSLPEEFKSAHNDFMRSKRGFGYWIWKPVVILEKLKEANPDDCVVYLDAGSSLNPNGRRRFQEYLEIVRCSPFKMLSFALVHTEAHWTKQNCASRIGVDRASPHMKTSQLAANLVVLQKTKSNIELLEEWREVAVADGYRYSNDTPSDEKNHPDFQEHRHDQSIFSLLRKLRGTEITHHEAQQDGRYHEMKQKIPVWLTRSRR
ncbi:hypothetical protein ACTL6U_19675 [Rhodovibrionaceae bacterium A322]